MKTQNKKTKTTAIITSLAIGLLLISTTTIIPNVNATASLQTKYNDIPLYPSLLRIS